MLILLAHNDGTGTNKSANYDIEVRVNADIIWRGRVEGHDRADGWPALLRQLAEQAQAPEHGWLCPHREHSTGECGPTCECTERIRNGTYGRP